MRPTSLAHVIIYSLVLVACLAQPTIGLNPEPRIDVQNSKYQLLNKQDNNVIPHDEKTSSPPSVGSGGADIAPDENQADEESRITIGEPYRSLIQTTARFAVAQSSLTEYVSVDTFMDIVGDASYALARPSILSKTLKAVAILTVTLLVGAFVVPASLIQNAAALLRDPFDGRSINFEKHLPRGLSELGIVNLLNKKTDDLLVRVGLNDSSCRQQTVCHAGELIRCTFPKASKATISFISENFSRPKYRSNKYLNAFLTGFIDQNCANNVEYENSAQSKSCAANFIKSLSFCSPAQKSPSTLTNSNLTNPKPTNYQSIRALRA